MTLSESRPDSKKLTIAGCHFVGVSGVSAILVSLLYTGPGNASSASDDPRTWNFPTSIAHYRRQLRNGTFHASTGFSVCPHGRLENGCALNDFRPFPSVRIFPLFFVRFPSQPLGMLFGTEL